MNSQVPNNWREISFGEITKTHKQGFYTKDSYSTKGVRLARITDLHGRKVRYSDMPYIEISEKEFEQFKVEEGDFLIARSGSIGRYGVAKNIPERTIFASYLINFKFDTNLVDIDFIGYVFQESLVSQLDIITQGSSNININAENIKRLKFYLPSLDEQKKIANVLGYVDEIIEFTELEIEKLQNLKKGMMQDLLTKGIGHTIFKDSPIGKIPASWIIEKMENLASIETGGKDTQDKVDGGRYPFYVRSPQVERINSYSFDGIAILTVGDGVGTGKVFHYTEGKIEIHQRVYKLADFRGDIYPKFLFYFFSENFVKQVDKYSAKTSVDSVRREMISRMSVPIPNIKEQREIGDAIDSVQKNITTLEEKIAKTKDLKMALLRDLLTGRVRVKV